jgi:hypothetical protein
VSAYAVNDELCHIIDEWSILPRKLAAVAQDAKNATMAGVRFEGRFNDERIA